MLENILESLPDKSKVMDYGCLGWKLLGMSTRKDLQHHGCDITQPAEIPNGAYFYLIDQQKNKIATEGDKFDLVVASHVLEHVYHPIDLFQELVRITKPDGLIYLETPSERSIMVKSTKNPDSHAFFSFWDDPTHIRPWTPASLYRLAISCGCVPTYWGYKGTWKDKIIFPFLYLYYKIVDDEYKIAQILKPAIGWECFLVAKKSKNIKGIHKYVYPYLRDVAKGVNSAVKFYNFTIENNKKLLGK